MGCATGLVKIVVLVFNFLCLIAGIGLIVVGALSYGEIKSPAITNLEFQDFATGPIFCIVLGSLVFVISFLGCCGAFRESPGLLLAYSIILVIILVLNIAAGVYVFLQVEDKDFNKTVYNTFEETFKKSVNKDAEAEKYIYEFEANVKCCGVKSYEDYNNQTNAKFALPKSCCTVEAKVCESTSKELYKEGCGNKFVDIIKYFINLAGIVACVFAGIELIGATAGLCLSSSYRNERRRRHY